MLQIFIHETSARISKLFPSTYDISDGRQRQLVVRAFPPLDEPLSTPSAANGSRREPQERWRSRAACERSCKIQGA